MSVESFSNAHYARVSTSRINDTKCCAEQQSEGPNEEIQALLNQLGKLIMGEAAQSAHGQGRTEGHHHHHHHHHGGGEGGGGGNDIFQMMPNPFAFMQPQGVSSGKPMPQNMDFMQMQLNMLQQIQMMQMQQFMMTLASMNQAQQADGVGGGGGEVDSCCEGGATDGASGTQGATPAQPQVSPEQAKINDEKLRGVSDKPLGPDDDLLPPEEQNMSVDDLKNLKVKDENGNEKQKYGLMANLGNQEGVRDKLKEVVGDFDKDPKAFARGEAYLQKIKHMPNPDGSARPADIVNNGKMEGSTSKKEIRSGTEMAILKDSFKGGPQVPDKDAPKNVDKNKAYGWLNEQKTLAPTNDKHVVNGANGRSDAQVFFMNVGDNIKKGFEKIGEGFKHLGEGIKNFAEGAIKAIGNAARVVGGALTFNPELIKEGANGFKDGVSQAWHSVDTTIKGAGEVLGGAAGALVSASPAGMAINELTGNAASRLATGVFEGTADTLIKGRNGLINAGEAAVKGDWKGVGKGIYDYANMASMFIPGAGQANMARNVAQQAGKEMIKAGAKDSVKEEAKYQYNEHKKNDGTQQA